MDEKISSVDMISELPDFLLHQILSLLPTKAAAKTCILSKRWCHVWQTFPIMDCCQFFFGKYLDVLNPNELGLPKDIRRNIFDQRMKFMSYVDGKLTRMFENGLCVRKFRLSMALVSVGLFPRVDRWLDLVSDLGVQELELRLTLGKERFYYLPMRILASQSITILRLKNSILIDCLCQDDLKLSSIVELHLYGCFISEDAISDLVSSIQSMEVLSLKDCSGFTKLTLNGHNKLKKVVYHSYIDRNAKKFSINLSNLEELDLMSTRRKMRKRAFTCDSLCPKLKRFSLCGVLIDVNSLRDIFSSFPLLEYFCLAACVVKQDVKLSSSVLKEVYLRNCTNTVKVEFDTPRLHLFRYYSDEMYHLSLKDVTSVRIAEIASHLRDMDSSWFLKWNNFLRMNKFQEVTMYIVAGQGHEIPFVTENLVREQLPEPLELKSMKLVINAFTSVKYAALLDGIFSNFRPTTLIFELNHSSPKHVKGLLNSLFVGAEPTFCEAETTKCWRHSLKGMKFINVKGFRAGTLLDLLTLNSLNNYLDNWATEVQRTLDSYETVQREMLSFGLSW